MAAVLDAVRRVRDDQVHRARPHQLVGFQCVAVEIADPARLARLVRLFAQRVGDVQTPPEPDLVTPQLSRIGRVLHALGAQPGLDELLVRLEILAVDLQAGGVEAVHHRLVQRGATPAQRVQHVQWLRDRRVRGGQQGDVQQKLREEFVRLAGVLLDRQQVRIGLGKRRHHDRAQHAVTDFEQRVERRKVRQQREIVLAERG